MRESFDSVKSRLYALESNSREHLHRFDCESPFEWERRRRMFKKKMMSLCLFPLFLPFIFLNLHSAAQSQTGYRDTLEERHYRHYSRDIVRFLGDVHIAEDEEIDGDVVTIGGSIKLKGRIDGDAVAVFGSIMMAPFSAVEGDAVSVAGRVRMAQGAEVFGDIVDGGWKWGGRREYEWEDEDWDWG